MNSSCSCLNNVSMKYRFEKMKLSEISAKVNLIKEDCSSKKLNLFKRVSSYKGPHLDRDIKCSQEILHFIKRKRVIFNDKTFDIPSLIPSHSLMSKVTSSAKEDGHQTNPKHIQPVNNSSSANLIIEQDERSNQLKLASSGYRNRRNPDSNKDSHNDCISKDSMAKSKKQATGDCASLNNSKDSFSRYQAHMKTQKTIGDKFTLNENSLKVKNNPFKQPLNQSSLKLNKHYQIEQGNEGVQMFLNTYLMRKCHHNDLNESTKHKSALSLSMCNSSKELAIGTNKTMRYEKRKASSLQEVNSNCSENKGINSHLLRLISNDLIKSRLESNKLNQIKKMNVKHCLDMKKQNDLNYKQRVEKISARALILSNQIVSKIGIYHAKFGKEMSKEYE